MATVKEVVLKHHKKEDGTWNVKIRVTQGKTSAYINTSHFVNEKQLRKDFSIKDQFISNILDSEIVEFRRKISLLGERVHAMSARQIITDITTERKGIGVDFGGFCSGYIQSLYKAGKTSSANNLKTVYTSLVDFFGTDKIDAKDINAQMLLKYEAFIKSPRTFTRINQLGKSVVYNTQGVGAGVYNYMRDLRRMFNAAKEHYNDEDNGHIQIAHYPFKKYKVGSTPVADRRNLSVEQVKAIRDVELRGGSVAELARDLFMLSFYLCGMNAVDIYSYNGKATNRIEYKRSKTTDKRKDKAFISIAIPSVSKPLVKRYVGHLKDRYSTSSGLNGAIADGLKEVLKHAGDIGVERLTFYHARHSFATIARNVCRFSKDDVALAMNHVDQSTRMTDTYIAPDWSIVDEVQAGVIAAIC